MLRPSHCDIDPVRDCLAPEVNDLLVSGSFRGPLPSVRNNAALPKGQSVACVKSLLKLSNGIHPGHFYARQRILPPSSR